MARMRILAAGQAQPLGAIRSGDSAHHRASLLVTTVLATSGQEIKGRPIISSVRVGNAPGTVTITAKRAGRMTWYRGDGQKIPMSQYNGGGSSKNVSALTAAQSVVRTAQAGYQKGQHGLVTGDGGVLITKWNIRVQGLGKHRKRE